MKKYFLTYGNRCFSQSKKRLEQEALQTELFNRIYVESPETLALDSTFKKALKKPEFKNTYNNGEGYGGGNYIWKPYVIYKHLLQMDEGDILIFSDAGCKINMDKINQLSQYLERLADSNFGVLSLQNGQVLPESAWCKGDVFDYFNCRTREDIYDTSQFASGRQLIKKCPHSMQIYRDWWVSARENPGLFDQSPSLSPNFKNFKANREQASLSLLCKKYGSEIQTFPSQEEFELKFPIQAVRIRK